MFQQIAIDDVVLFADEGGSLQVGVDWDTILPSWLKVLAATATPEEYARSVKAVIQRHFPHGRDKMLGVAFKVGDRNQRAMLSDVLDQES